MIDSIFKNNRILHNFHITYFKLDARSKVFKKEKYLTLTEAQLVVSELVNKKGYKKVKRKLTNSIENIEIQLNF